MNRVMPVLIGNDHYLMVTVNLMELLFRCSGANTPTDQGNTTTLMWTDQLCLNRYDSPERASQVSMMQRIYAEALDTRLCLGEQDDSAERAFELIKCFEFIDTRSADPKVFSIAGVKAEETRAQFLALYTEAIGRNSLANDKRWRDLYELLRRLWVSPHMDLPGGYYSKEQDRYGSLWTAWL